MLGVVPGRLHRPARIAAGRAHAGAVGSLGFLALWGTRTLLWFLGGGLRFGGANFYAELAKQGALFVAAALVGLVLPAWALMTLRRPDVAAAFARGAVAPPPPRPVVPVEGAPAPPALPQARDPAAAALPAVLKFVGVLAVVAAAERLVGVAAASPSLLTERPQRFARSSIFLSEELVIAFTNPFASLGVLKYGYYVFEAVIAALLLIGGVRAIRARAGAVTPLVVAAFLMTLDAGWVWAMTARSAFPEGIASVLSPATSGGLVASGLHVLAVWLTRMVYGYLLQLVIPALLLMLFTHREVRRFLARERALP